MMPPRSYPLLMATLCCCCGGAQVERSDSAQASRPRPAPTSVRPSSATAPPTGLSPAPANTTALAATLSCRPEGPVTSPRLITRSIDDPNSPLRVLLRESTGTGTSHYADELTLQSGPGPAWTHSSDVARGELVPLMRRLVAIDDRTELLLGWSSQGGGRQSIHAWLIGLERGALRQIDGLVVDQLRGRAGLFLRRSSSGIQIGVPAPVDPGRLIDGPWLQTGRAAIALRDWQRLRYEPFGAAERQRSEAFCPPFGTMAPIPQQVAWLTITPQGFTW